MTQARLRWLEMLPSLAVLALLAVGAAAQTAHFASVNTAVGSGLAFPRQLAVAAAGDVYIADVNNNRVLKETRSVGTFTQSVVASGLNSPIGVAVDAAGNVFVSDTLNNRVLEEVPSGGSYTQSVIASTGLSHPAALALDPSGNVYIIDLGNSRVLVEQPSGGSYTQKAVIGGLTNPVGLAVDLAGNVYISDQSLDTIVKETPSGSTFTPTTVVSSITSNAIAVDGQGNLYVADLGSNGVLKETLSGGSYTPTPVLSGLNAPQGVGVDLTGNFLAIANSGFSTVSELQLEGGDFGSQSVGTATPSLSLTFTFDTGGSLGSLPVVLTQGAAGLDFADAGTGSCTTQGTSHAYGIGDSCTVDVTFNPARPGLRSGAVELKNGSGAVIATAYIHGTGAGPQLTFDSGAQTTLNIGSTTLIQPEAVAVDGAGNVYLADDSGGTAVKIPAGGGTGTVLATGLFAPRGIAVDGAGNVFVSDSNNHAVDKIALDGTITVATSSPSVAQNLAVDGLGNLYYADSVANQIVQVTPAGQETTLGVGLNNPSGVAIDAAGNLYVADSGNNRVLKIPPGCTVASCQVTLGSGFNDPIEVAVDAAGNVFVSDVNNGRGVEIAPDGSQSNFATGPGFIGFAIDSSGSLYLDNLTVLNRSAAGASLSFPNTVYGQTSASESVTLHNDGTAPLTATQLSIGAGFVQQSSGGTDCSSTSAIASGSGCTLQLAFRPTAAAAASSTAVLTDNNLNGTGVTQSIALSGTGTQAAITPSLVGSVSKTYDGTAAAALTSANYTFTGKVGSDDVGITTPASGAYAAAAAGTGISVTSATLALTGATASNYQLAATTATGSVGAITAAAVTPSLTGTVSKAYDGTTSATLAPANISLSGVIPADAGHVAASGTAVYAVPGAGSSLAVNASGIALGGSAAGNYSLSATIATGGVGQITPVALTVTASNGSMTYGGTLPTITAGYSGFVHGETATALTTQPACTTTATASSAAASAQTSSCSGAVDANYTISYVPGTVTVGQAALTVTASNGSMTYGAALPTITAGYSGFVNGNASASLTAQPTCTSTATAASPAGSVQASSCSGAVDANYTISYLPGTVTVGSATLTATASSGSMAYGGAPPAITAGYSGFVNGQTAAVITTQATCTTTATSASPAGSAQTSSCSGAAAANYTLAYLPGTVTLGKAALAVSANPVSIAFGAAIPVLTPSYSGFVNGDTTASLSGAPSLTTTATASSDVGSYPITVSTGTLASNNYTFTFGGGTLTVGQASQTIAFNALANQTLGAPPLTLSATASSGLPVTFSLVSGPASLSGTTLAITGGGTVVVEADQAGNDNFQAAPPVRQSFTGTAPGLLLSTSTLNFGSDLVAASTAPQPVSVENTGTAPLAITAIATVGDYSQVNNCPSSLPAGASCTVNIIFTASAVGTRAGVLTVATALAGTQTVALAGSGTNFAFTLDPGGSTSATIDGGGTATYQLDLTPGTFTGNVTLACGIVPAVVACSITPGSAALTAGAAATPAVVTVSTVSRSLLLPRDPRTPLWPWLLLLLSLPLAIFLRRTRTWLLGGLAYGLLFAAACGGVNNLPYGGGGTPPGRYQITASAAVGSVAHTVTLTLEVQ